MDKLIIEATPSMRDDVMVVKLDGEAAWMIGKLSFESGVSKKRIISEMVKFCFPRTEIRKVSVGFRDMEE